MPKKVSEVQKKEILKSFINGIDLKEISNFYNFSNVTITRQLKNILGEEQFNQIKLKNSHLYKNVSQSLSNKKTNNDIESSLNEGYSSRDFVEVAPITSGIEVNNQKDLSSKPLKNVTLPDVVYMLVDKNIELKPKMLKDYPEWSFMPEDDLKRMTLEIYDDQKYAKKFLSKNQKLIKIPNPKVFLIASRFLKSKGISRLIFNDLLLSF